MCKPPEWEQLRGLCAQVAHAWEWALVAHVLSWYMQIHPGHIIFEKSKPALTDSVVQAFATAPFFVWLEFLFVCGYRPKLRAEITERTSQLRVRKSDTIQVD